MTINLSEIQTELLIGKLIQGSGNNCAQLSRLTGVSPRTIKEATYKWLSGSKCVRARNRLATYFGILHRPVQEHFPSMVKSFDYPVYLDFREDVRRKVCNRIGLTDDEYRDLGFSFVANLALKHERAGHDHTGALRAALDEGMWYVRQPALPRKTEAPQISDSENLMEVVSEAG